MATKTTGTKTASLAGKVLNGSVKPTAKQIKTLAASALAQDPKKGPNKSK